MKVLFVDDELEINLQVLYKSVCSFFSDKGGQVIKKLSGLQALHYLRTDNNGNNIDIAIIDQWLDDHMTGQELGENITKEFPHIALVMLTGRGDWQTKFQLCCDLMRIGFCDFIDKSDFQGEKIVFHLNRVLELSSIQSKQHLKKLLFDSEYAIRDYAQKLNNINKNYFLNTFSELSHDRKLVKKILEYEELLDIQESVLKHIDELNKQLKYDDYKKEICVKAQNLGAAIHLIRYNNYTLEQLTSDVLKKLERQTNHADFKLNNRVDSTYKEIFKLTSNTGARSGGISIPKYQNSGLIIMALLIKEKDSNRWHTTIELALKSLDEEGFFTFVDHIIKDVNELGNTQLTV